MKEQRKVRFMLVVLMVLALVAGTKMTAKAKTSGDYKYNNLENGTVAISAYTGEATNLKIPKKLGKKKVTGIDWYCEFSDSVESIEIPEGVTFIGVYGISAANLKTITVPKSMKSIGGDTFTYLKKFSYITYKGTKKQWKSLETGLEDRLIEIHCKDGIIPGKSNETQLKSVKASKKSFKATWTKADNVSEYQVQYATDTKFKKNKKTITITNPKTTSITVNKLKSKQKYYVQVRTYRKWYNSSKKSYSDWCNLEGVHVK